TRRVDTVVLDKTGTVTTGAMTTRGVHPAEGVSAEEVLRRAGAVEHASEHPIGAAIAAAAAEQGELPEVTDFENLAGRGVRGRVQGVTVLAGRPSLFADYTADSAITRAREQADERGLTVIAVGWDGAVQGL